MKIKNIATVLLLLVAVGLHGQTVSRGEYFFDTDPGVGNGTSIPAFTADDTVNLSLNVDVTGLADGMHHLFIRFRTSTGKWGISEGKQFYVIPASAEPPAADDIASAEYFFDTDPGVGNGTALPSFTANDTVNLTPNIDVSGLDAGMHHLFIRFKDEGGKWGISEGKQFYVIPASTEPPVADDIVAAEYFFDTDPGVGNGTALSSFSASDTVNLTPNIDVSGLDAGMHHLFIRFKDEGGKWGISEGKQFYIIPDSDQPTEAADIVSTEYFFDTDPGVGNGTALPSFTAADTVNVAVEANVTGLSAGTHNLFVRFIDADGHWGIYEGSEFEVLDCLAPTVAFDAASGQACLNEVTAITDQSTDVDPAATYAWDIGNDGTVDYTTVGNITHTFDSLGTFEVKLKISNGECVDSTIQTVTVHDCNCSEPTELSISSLQYDRVTISWNPIYSALSYVIRFREVGSGSWQFINVTAPDTFKIKAGLTQLTDYEWQVKSNCDGESSAYGELQTFTTPEVPCDPPTTYSTTGILDDRATLNWSEVSTALEYVIRFREVGSGSWTFLYETGTSRTKASLTPGTDYEWQVKVTCDGPTSSYGPLQTFTTYVISPCPTPETFTTTLIQGDRATLGWSNVEEATAYKIRFREVGASNWTNIYVNGSQNSKVKAGLTPLTDYEWQLRTKCGALNTAYGPLQTFTTGPDCPKPTGFFTDNIQDDRATMNWSEVADAVEYRVKLRPSGGSWTYMTITAPETFKTRAGLIPETDYEWRVRSVCATTQSPYAGVEDFTTTASPAERLADEDDGEFEDGISVYPNPSSGIFVLDAVGTVNYEVLDPLGRTVISRSATAPLTLDLSNQPSGIYILKLSTETEDTMIKLLKE